MEQGVLVDRSGSKPFSDCKDELVRIDDGFRPTSSNTEIKHRNTLQKVVNLNGFISKIKLKTIKFLNEKQIVKINDKEAWKTILNYENDC